MGGGWLTDAMQARGHRDANLKTSTFGGLLAIPFAVAIPLASDPMVAVSLLAPAVLFGAIPFGGGVAALPMVSPPQFRAQLVAFYLLVANILGQAGGPWLVAQFTDRVFADDAAVGWSLMISVPLLLAIGSLLTLSGWRPLRAQLSDASA